MAGSNLCDGDHQSTEEPRENHAGDVPCRARRGYSLRRPRYDAVRGHTERLAVPLSPEDQTVQSMADVSPTKWHRAHVTWFFETFLLAEHEPEFAPFQEQY